MNIYMNRFSRIGSTLPISQMANPIIAHNLIEQSKAFPASRRNISLPLTFLDLPLAGPIYVKRQFFYKFTISTPYFCKTTLPTLKRSLSLALHHFYPLAGNLLSPPPPQKPFIRCTDVDSVLFTIISSSADFNHLSSNHPKNLKDLDHLVPKLQKPTLDEETETFVFPLMALQASVFPKQGLCIAITYCHAMDDRCCSHFMKTWSLIHQKIQNGMLLENYSLPCFDRGVLRDPRELENVFLRDYYEERKAWRDELFGQTQATKHNSDDEEYFKATIVFSKEEIERLKNLIKKDLIKTSTNISYNISRGSKHATPQTVSKFVVTCAFIWASLVKTRYSNNDDEQENEYFRFAADCRGRLGYPIPEGYFGNCLMLCHAMLKRKDLKGEDGFVKAVRVIQSAIIDMENEPFRDAEDWRDSITKMFKLGSVLLVTGSPKFTVYETDFGFGRPIKVEMVHSIKAMSLAESIDDKEGGLEVGLVFKRGEFVDFASIIKQGLRKL